MIFCRAATQTAEERSPTTSSARRSREKIREFGETLTGKDAVIFERRRPDAREEPLTLQEIGDEYGISRERVRQIEERLKKRLGAYLRDARSPTSKDGHRVDRR